jgi:hypothetical protein
MVKFFYDMQRLKAIMTVKLQNKRWDPSLSIKMTRIVLRMTCTKAKEIFFGFCDSSG